MNTRWNASANCTGNLAQQRSAEKIVHFKLQSETKVSLLQGQLLHFCALKFRKLIFSLKKKLNIGLAIPQQPMIPTTL